MEGLKRMHYRMLIHLALFNIMHTVLPRNIVLLKDIFQIYFLF